jgi:ribosomal protein L7/L12
MQGKGRQAGRQSPERAMKTAKGSIVITNGRLIDGTGAAPVPDAVVVIRDDPAKKIQAIALHREQTGIGLKEAKNAVEAYIAGRS